MSGNTSLCNRVAMVRQNFFKVREFCFLLATGFGKGFPCWQMQCCFQKTFVKELIFMALLVGKLSCVDLESWFVVSEKLGNFYDCDKWQPWCNPTDKFGDYHTVCHFCVATHSSRAPASGSQTGDTLGKALASVRFSWCFS